MAIDNDPITNESEGESSYVLPVRHIHGTPSTQTSLELLSSLLI